MPAPYSIDLREKVMAAIERGEKKSHVSRMFNISRDTIDRWLNRMIAAYCERGLSAPFTVEGSSNRVVARNLARNLLAASTSAWTSRNSG